MFPVLAGRKLIGEIMSFYNEYHRLAAMAIHSAK
jgi:hypothetical protein